AHGKDAVRRANVVELGGTVQIDDDPRARQAHVQHRDEALSAGQHLRLVAVLRQDFGGALRRLGQHVVERDRLHVRSPPALLPRAFSMRPSTADGPSGARVTRTSNGRSASSTALAIAAGGEIAPPSPMPLMPSGFRGDGYSRCTVSIAGNSLAVGIR